MQNAIIKTALDPSAASPELLPPNRELAQILERVAAILNTPKGSLPLDRDFGLPTDFLDSPRPQARSMLITAVRESIEKYEPQVTVTGISFKPPDPSNPALLQPVVQLEVRLYGEL